MQRRTFLQLAGASAFAWTAPIDAWAHDADPRQGVVKQRIGILGAGLAGLSAALELVRAGHDVTVLEAQQRPGGRVYTLRAPFADGLHAECGAGRIPSTHALTLDYVRRYKLELDPFAPETGSEVFVWRGKRQLVPHGKDPDLSGLDLAINDEERALGYNGWTDRYLAPVKARLRALPRDGWPLPQVADWGEISAGDYLKQQGASDDVVQAVCFGFERDSLLDFVHDMVTHDAPPLKKIRGGNDRLPRAMAEELKARIRYGARIVRIEQDERAVTITTETQGAPHAWRFDRVVCTLPYSVLRDIAVAPAWTPRKDYAIRNLYMGAVTRVFAQTRRRFWEDRGCNGFASTEQALEIWSPTFNQPGPRGIVMSYLYEALAEEYALLDEPTRIARGLQMLERIHPGLRDELETAASWSWLENPYARGAFMVTRPGDFRTILPYVATIEGRIHFAGEHTSPWTGWMQGALHSGLRAAREVHTAPASIA